MKSLDSLTLPLQGRHLIEASAGTGKTYTIANLLLRLLLGHDAGRTGVRPRQLGEILIVTFTRVATEELRARIRQRIVSARRAFAGEGVASGDRVLAALLTDSSDRAADHQRLCAAELDLDLASISTIHGFAARMLERLAFETRVGFSARIDENDRATVTELIRDLWRERVYPLPPLAASLLFGDAQLGRLDGTATIEEFAGVVRGLYIKEGLAFRDLPEASWEQLLEALYAHERELLAWWQREAAIAMPVLESLPLNKGGRSARDASLAALQRGDRGPGQLDARVFIGLSGSFLESELNKKKRQTGLPRLDVFKISDAVLALGRELRKRFLHDAVRAASRRIAQLKAETGNLGFDDLLRLLATGLEGEGGEVLARAIRREYPVALIDEFQDTDPLQWRVFARIYALGDGALFLIGDPKQAIYAFRGADVYAYINARRGTPDRYSLETNYRSVKPLVAAVNALFALRADGDPFLARDDIPFIAVRASGQPDRRPLQRNGEDLGGLQLIHLTGETPLLAEPYRVRMSAAVARHLADLLQGVRRGQVRLGDRPLRPGDIALLVRGRPDALVLQTELRRLRIASVYRGRDSVFSTAEARDLYQILLAVIDAADERRLRAALACRLLGDDAAGLDGLLADEQRMAIIQRRWLDHAERLERHGVQAMFRTLLFEHAVPARLLATPDGERRLTNCLHIIELLQLAGETLESNEALLARFAELIANPDGNREQEQLRLESDGDCIQILSIHISKGLEFPVVYLPFQSLWRPADAPLFHDSRTLTPVYDLDHDDTAMASAERERLAEDMRLLYVGLTRAAQLCVLGIADTRYGHDKGSSLKRSALGYLIGVDQDDNADVEPAIERLRELPGIRFAADVDAEPLPAEANDRAAPDWYARPFARTLERDWRSSSYSALVHRGLERVESLFRQPELAVAVAPATVPRRFDLFEFPRGARPGTFLHGILERADFATPGSAANAAMIRAALLREGYPETWEPALCAMLGDVLDCALDGDGLRLSGVGAGRRCAEMRFELPAQQVRADVLNRLLARYEPLAHAATPLEFTAWRGMLTGAIDLVFEYDGRYYLADFKSNHLGDSCDDYLPACLDEAIRQHRYDLQYLLYSVALTRYLRARLGDGFDHATQFGGVFYLFLRGMRRDNGARTGVFFARPEQRLIESLDALFNGGSGDVA